MFESDLLNLFVISVACGAVGSFIGFLVAYSDRSNERLNVGNLSGIGFLIGASIGALIALFESMIGRL